MRTAQSLQKSYADRQRRDLEFVVGDHVSVGIARMKGVMHSGRRGKLSPRLIDPFEILARAGTLAYRIELPPSPTAVHNVFHVSMLRKYISNPSHVLDYEPLHLMSDLSLKERPVQILEHEERRLRTQVLPMVMCRTFPKLVVAFSVMNSADWSLGSSCRRRLFFSDLRRTVVKFSRGIVH
ncbi:uncharacterized protein [Henckelia pumila]|uniref:uncharacterized protein n=1 Tax=Henckelia pumila TaxID=405737 RepID=UPI003C6DF264